MSNSKTLDEKIAKSSQKNAKTAKNVLQNWLKKCFQADENNILIKSGLFKYYQAIASFNKWRALDDSIFFEILKTIFHNISYDDSKDHILGLKLVIKFNKQNNLFESSSNNLKIPTVIIQDYTEVERYRKNDSSLNYNHNLSNANIVECNMNSFNNNLNKENDEEDKKDKDQDLTCLNISN